MAETNKFSWTSPQFCHEEWVKIQPEVYQKIVDGYQKGIIELKMAEEHLAKCYNYFMYNFGTADLAPFSDHL